MTTLDPALDKLRSKELSFGCFYSICKGGRLKRYLGTRGSEEFVRNVHYNVYSKHKVGKYAKGVILGHALTRGRIQLLMVGMEATLTEKMILNGVGIEEVEIVGGLYRIFKENTLYDQTEIERMTSPKRPELRELLVKFAEYI